MARDSALNNDSENEEGKQEEGVSIEELKHQILGRSVSSMYDLTPSKEQQPPSASPNNNNNNATASQPILNPSTTTTINVANHLSQELSCPICHDR
eukprot:CAMPEP_0183719750 /NCGR_PEP_ID=MMETSP0737-20130205/12568_1 /TAXON_ID=385413 /ORGANISM="Thalassiosira miniscula, Strain CCMP1093" /LENGTH=95 /DNA_ID=CAMNT_0025949493 /DNA_START=8 /DNA_END=291 /DNA_ORIENTATION=-